MPPVEELRAALKVAELEEQLVAAKAGDGPDADLKLALRQARQQHRELRASRPPEPGEVRPDTIQASAEVQV